MEDQEREFLAHVNYYAARSRHRSTGATLAGMTLLAWVGWLAATPEPGVWSGLWSLGLGATTVAAVADHISYSRRIADLKPSTANDTREGH